uniref:Major facilitator superfamily (MFS) profile domain-containing protein n=1 Tax=Psilocybe cubensis TaxID=181762 RepID=A0A8H7XU46_PSICU
MENVNREPEQRNSLSGSSKPGKVDLEHFDDKEVKRAVFKMDLTILPVMTIIQLFALLDRFNLGNARVAGLQKDLEITDHQYQIAVMVALVPYILSQLPANLLLQRVGSHILIPMLVMIRGVIVVAEAFLTSFRGLFSAQFFLGLFDGPLFPGILLYLSGCYTREELSFRIALFFSGASLSGAFSGLLAGAIATMDGVGNKPSWAWIFILEGLVTVLVGLAAFFLIPATPQESKFLSSRQKKIVVQRLQRDRPVANLLHGFNIKDVLSVVVSPHVLISCAITFFLGVNSSGLAYFLPSMVNQLGFSPNETQLLSVGPFAAAFASKNIPYFV